SCSSLCWRAPSGMGCGPRAPDPRAGPAAPSRAPCEGAREPLVAHVLCTGVPASRMAPGLLRRSWVTRPRSLLAHAGRWREGGKGTCGATDPPSHSSVGMHLAQSLTQIQIRRALTRRPLGHPSVGAQEVRTELTVSPTGVCAPRCSGSVL